MIRRPKIFSLTLLVEHVIKMLSHHGISEAKNVHYVNFRIPDAQTDGIFEFSAVEYVLLDVFLTENGYGKICLIYNVF